MKIGRLTSDNKLLLKNELIEYTPVSIDISTGKTSGMTSSSMYNSSYSPQNLVDGNITFGANRAFASANNAPLPQWFQIDLGDIYYVDTVRWINNRANARLPGDYRIETSTTGAFNGEEILVASKDNNTTYTWVEHTFTTIGCRYVRMTVTRIHAGAYFELAEWQILGYRNKISLKEASILVDEIIEFPPELMGKRNLFTGLYTGHANHPNYNMNSWTGAVVKIKPNTSYTVKRWSPSNRFQVMTGRLDNGIYARMTEVTHTVGDYTENHVDVALTITSGENDEYLVVYLSNQGHFDDILLKVEKGNRPTPYTPAPEDLGLSYSEDIDSFGIRLLGSTLMVSEIIEDCHFGNILDFGEILEGKVKIGGIGNDGASSSDIAEIPSDLFPLYYDGWHEFYDYEPPITDLFPDFYIQYDTETKVNVSHAFITSYASKTVEDRLFEYDNSYHNYRIIIGYPLLAKTVGVKGEFILRKGSATGEILYKQYYDVTVGQDAGCYLTTAMVGYFDKDDDGIELAAMRELRKHSGYKYQDVLEEYSQASPIIIRGIERSENKDYYYNMIKDVVDNIVIWVADEEWERAETAYLDLYYYLKEKWGV